MQKDNTKAYLYSFLTGFLVVLLISIITGRREAWDSSLYFVLGIPVMMVTIYFITKQSSEKFWRWPLTMALGQSLAMSLGGGSLTLWPLALIAMTICSLPQFLVGLYVSKKK